MYFDAKDILLNSRIKEKIKESLNGPISVWKKADPQV